MRLLPAITGLCDFSVCNSSHGLVNYGGLDLSLDSFSVWRPTDDQHQDILIVTLYLWNFNIDLNIIQI